MTSGGGDVIAAEMEEVVDLVVGGEEALRLAGRFEPLHLPFSPSRRLVRILGPVVEALVPAVLDPGHQLPLRRAIARQLVGDHDARRPALPLQQLAQQALGGPLVAPALHQHVEHDAVLVDRPPQPVLLAGDFDHDLIEVPLVAGAGAAAGGSGWRTPGRTVSTVSHNRPFFRDVAATHSSSQVCAVAAGGIRTRTPCCAGALNPSPTA